MPGHVEYPELGSYTIDCMQRRRDMEAYYPNLRLLCQAFAAKLDLRAQKLGSFITAINECGPEVIQPVRDVGLLLEHRRVTHQPPANPNYLYDLLRSWELYCNGATELMGGLWEYVAEMEIPECLLIPDVTIPPPGGFIHDQRRAPKLAREQKRRAEELETRKAYDRIADAKVVCLR